MSNMFVRFISHCKLGGYLDLFFLVSLVYLVISPSQQQFCGHQNVRHKRGASRLERHTNRKYNDFRPQGQQEEQVVIDGSLVREISGGGVTIRPSRRGRPGGEGRTGCCQNSSSSTSSSSTALLSANAIKTIETAVFLDQALDNRFSGQSNGLVELNKLVQTIMNQVQHLFRYSSMKIPIKIRLVLIEHIKDNEKLTGLAAPNSERGDIDAYLSNFCNWQQSRLDQDKRLWWDHAILLSGLDLYKATPGGKNHSGVLGLAWVGGMCKGNYSCTINEATNLESAFVIAHEIGHSLGVMHDGQRNNCDPNGYIMSEKTGAGKVHWSRCSNHYLNESINRGQLGCLDVEQSGAKESMYDLDKLRPPGQVYSVGDQCKLAFGANYTSFVTRQQPFNAVCRELWCVSGTWAKAAHPALEGSTCGDGEQVCFEGKCIRARTK